jgi:hypothetical protein
MSHKTPSIPICGNVGRSHFETLLQVRGRSKFKPNVIEYIGRATQLSKLYIVAVPWVRYPDAVQQVTTTARQRYPLTKWCFSNSMPSFIGLPRIVYLDFFLGNTNGIPYAKGIR